MDRWLPSTDGGKKLAGDVALQAGKPSYNSAAPNVRLNARAGNSLEDGRARQWGRGRSSLFLKCLGTNGNLVSLPRFDVNTMKEVWKFEQTRDIHDRGNVDSGWRLRSSAISIGTFRARRCKNGKDAMVESSDDIGARFPVYVHGGWETVRLGSRRETVGEARGLSVDACAGDSAADNRGITCGFFALPDKK
jgi:hypothetical protein